VQQQQQQKSERKKWQIKEVLIKYLFSHQPEKYKKWNEKIYNFLFAVSWAEER
jgi:hypothetical protein